MRYRICYKYDGHFVLQYMYQHESKWMLKEESLVMNGSEILQIKCGRYRFIDSLNFFSVPLSKLPLMFSLECSSKGYYPHFFNTPENFNYIGTDVLFMIFLFMVQIRCKKINVLVFKSSTMIENPIYLIIK